MRSFKKQTVKTFFNSNDKYCLLCESKENQRSEVYMDMIRKLTAVFKWCLIDKDLCVEFSDRFTDIFIEGEKDEGLRRLRKDFELILEQRLKDLEP